MARAITSAHHGETRGRDLLAKQARGHPRSRRGAFRAPGLRGHQVGGHRRRRRRRLDGALPLLRVEAPLPVRDHARRTVVVPHGLRRGHARARALRGRVRRGPARELRAQRGRGRPLPRARRRAGPAQPAAGHRARGGGPAARPLARAGARDRMVELPLARDGDRRDPRGRPATPDARAARLPQQRLALVPPARER